MTFGCLSQNLNWIATSKNISGETRRAMICVINDNDEWIGFGGLQLNMGMSAYTFKLNVSDRDSFDPTSADTRFVFYQIWSFPRQYLKNPFSIYLPKKLNVLSNWDVDFFFFFLTVLTLTKLWCSFHLKIIHQMIHTIHNHQLKYLILVAILLTLVVVLL